MLLDYLDILYFYVFCISLYSCLQIYVPYTVVATCPNIVAVSIGQQHLTIEVILGSLVANHILRMFHQPSHAFV